MATNRGKEQDFDKIVQEIVFSEERATQTWSKLL